MRARCLNRSEWRRRFSERGALRTTGAIIGLLSLVALALPVMTGISGAAGLTTAFNGLDGNLDGSSVIQHQSDPTGQADGSTYTTGPKENHICPDVGFG